VTGIGGIFRRFRRSCTGRVVVAAVPVRARAAGGLEFLIVRTSNGERWTFPKGGCDAGETPSEAAAREAVEEAGATGRILAEPLGEYRYGDDVVTAYLLLVDAAGEPEEPGRKPRWCGREATRSRLAEGREGAFGEQMEHVLLAAQRAAGRVL
jgi:8-oxo-dGTP pyrophosphatase MutT (NUDIX family)